jgi:hypothetical protein
MTTKRYKILLLMILLCLFGCYEIGCSGDDDDDDDNETDDDDGKQIDDFEPWHVELVADDTFRHSMVLDSAGHVHIGFQDSSSGELRYATNLSGSWETQSTSDNTENRWHRSVSTATDSDGHIHICSIAGVASDRVLYTSNASGMWKTELVAENLGLDSAYASIAVDVSGYVHIAFHNHDSGEGDDLWYATNRLGDWFSKKVSSGGLGADIVADNQSHSYVSYNNDGLQLATNKGGEWMTTQVDSWARDRTSLLLDGLGRLHVAYIDADHMKKYATNASGDWETTLVDSQSSSFGSSDVALALGPEGAVHMAYVELMEDSGSEIHYATNQSGSWRSAHLEKADRAVNPQLAVSEQNTAHLTFDGDGAVWHATFPSGYETE